MGKEFYNADSMYSVMKVSVVERFNRTLKNDMWKMFTLNGNYKWIDLLSRLVSNYNARKHLTIGMRSVDVTSAVAERFLATVQRNEDHRLSEIQSRLFGTREQVQDGLKRLIRQIGPPRCLRSLKYSVRIPLTYLLEDYRRKSIAGAFYEYEYARLIQIYTSWKKYCTEGETRFM